MEASIYEAFLTKLTERVKRIRVGLPMDPGTEMGSLISHEHRDRVDGFVQRAVLTGAKVAVGGCRPDAPELAAGAYYMPTVVYDAKQDSEIVQEENIGPVLVVLPFEGEEEGASAGKRHDLRTCFVGLDEGRVQGQPNVCGYSSRHCMDQ